MVKEGAFEPFWEIAFGTLLFASGWFLGFFAGVKWIAGGVL